MSLTTAPVSSAPVSHRVIMGQHGRFTFRAARLIAHDDVCEPLHGADFSLAVTLHGTLGPTERVVDFRLVNAALQDFCRSLHMRTLVPLRNPALSVTPDHEGWSIRHSSRVWVLPAQDVLPLEVINPTNETLAVLCAQAIRAALHGSPEEACVQSITVAVGDAEGCAEYDLLWRQAT